MQNNYERFLEPVLATAALQHQKHKNKNSFNVPLSKDLDNSNTHIAEQIKIPYEFNGKDYLTFLLHINAEIEHGLMLQYLYAAYSIGGPQVPEQYQAQIRGWQESILGVAKEEMGHFISVQNVLKLIGASLNFGRTDYPWDTPFYPFPFTLEPLTLGSLAKYVYAESPDGWIELDTPNAKAVRKYLLLNTSEEDKGKVAGESLGNLHRVGALFSTILKLIKDPQYVPDEVFLAKTYSFQGKFDEWGRGYTGGQRGNSQTGPKGSPDVLVVALTCRDDAYNALLQISEQGEAMKMIENNGSPSHFDRFLCIFKEMKKLTDNPEILWNSARNVAENPFISQNDYQVQEASFQNTFTSHKRKSTKEKKDAIINREAKLWAHLFNMRYRMLLNYLAHSFLLDDGFNSSGSVSPRATIINATFGEMYNLKSIANVLVQTPLDKEGTGSKMAGPTFSVPYTLELPMGEMNRWYEHLDTLHASEIIADNLIVLVSTNHHKYLYALKEADQKLMIIINKIISANK